MSDFVEAYINIVVLDPTDPLPVPGSLHGGLTQHTLKNNPQVAAEQDTATKSNVKKRQAPSDFAGPTRKSKRIKSEKNKAVKQTIVVAKTDSVKVMKIKVCNRFLV